MVSRHYSSVVPSRGLSDAYRNTTIAVRKRGMKTREIVLRSLMRIWRLGPAVSFHGSPTVSPTTVAACVSVFFPPKCPISTYFFALSIAAPPHIIIMASGIAEIVAPTTSAPTAVHPKKTPTTIGASTGIVRLGSSLSETWDLSQLPSNLLDHAIRTHSDCVYRSSREDKWKHAAN